MVKKYYVDAGRNFWGDGMEVKFWGGGVSPIPLGFVALYIKDIFYKTFFTKHCLQNILHDHKN